VFAGLGAQALAGFNVVLAINSVAFMPAWGLGSAGAILAGQAIGAGKKDDVWPIIRLTLKVAMVWMGALGILYAVVPDALIEIFASDKTTPEFIALGASMLLLSAAWQLFDATAITLSESLRAAGDTAWTAWVRLALAWAVFTPTALIAVKVFDAGAIGAMVCMAAYVAILAGLFAYRFRSNKWREIELIEPSLVES
jgi:multidrug resistance protein, MATE family